ncbi:MAG: IS630 family transposase [Lentisphaerales bacterium]|nr:IS630 family transposase [Lentisphaerales bacterium]
MSKNAKRGDQKTQAYIRNQAVKAVVAKGQKPAVVADVFGVALNTVYKWVRMYKSSGSSALKDNKRGCHKGSRSSLSPEQCKKIKKLITDKNPEQLKMPFVLWTRKAVQELIQDQFSIGMPIRTVGEYLNRWGFTPQKPIKKSYEQQPKEVQKWLDNEYPTIKQDAVKEGAEIHWGDETGCTNKISHGRSYAPKGQTPTLVLSTKEKLKINMISSVSNQGQVFFDIHEGKINSAEFIEFMKKLIRCTDKKVYFIVDNLPQHRSKLVKNWLNENKDAIKLFYLPSYSPELNPDEYLNCDLKRSLNTKRMPRNNSQLKENTMQYMIELSQNSEKVKSYFRHPKVKYAS